MLKTIIITQLFFWYSLFAVAQQQRVFSTKYFKRNVYIGANAGLNLFVGEKFTAYLKTDPFSAIDIIARANIGYNYTPVLGVRSFIGYTEHKWPNNTIEKFSAAHVTIDLTYNLSNRIASYNLIRPLDILLFTGVGVSQSIMADFPTQPSIIILHGGLQADYRLTHFFEFNFIGDLNIVNDNYNGNSSNRLPFDLFPSLSLGITYHFRKKQHCDCE